MIDRNFLIHSYQKVNDYFDVSLHNIFNQFPAVIQDKVGFFARDMERAATLLVVGLEHKKLKTSLGII